MNNVPGKPQFAIIKDGREVATFYFLKYAKMCLEDERADYLNSEVHIEFIG